MRRIRAIAVLLVVGGAIAVAVRQAGMVRAAFVSQPQRAAALPSDGQATAWVFVREGCVHCRRHLGALRGALAALPRAERERAAKRLRFVGGAAAAPVPGAAVFPDSLRRAAGVRATPCTWLVDAHGRIRESWPGARGERAWSRALAFVCAPAEDVP